MLNFEVKASAFEIRYSTFKIERVDLNPAKLPNGTNEKTHTVGPHGW